MVERVLIYGNADWSPTDGRERWGLLLVLGIFAVCGMLKSWKKVDGRIADPNVA